MLPAFNPNPDGLDLAGKLVAKNRWRGNHSRMISAPENLQVSTTGQRCADPHADFAGADHRYRDIVYLHVLLTIQDGCRHLLICFQGFTMILREFSCGVCASAIASLISSKGNLWVIRSRTSSLRLKIRSDTSASSIISEL